MSHIFCSKADAIDVDREHEYESLREKLLADNKLTSLRITIKLSDVMSKCVLAQTVSPIFGEWCGC